MLLAQSPRRNMLSRYRSIIIFQQQASNFMLMLTPHHCPFNSRPWYLPLVDSITLYNIIAIPWPMVMPPYISVPLRLLHLRQPLPPPPALNPVLPWFPPLILLLKSLQPMTLQNCTMLATGEKDKRLGYWSL